MRSSILVELKLYGLLGIDDPIEKIIDGLHVSGFVLNTDYEVVHMMNNSKNKEERSVIVHGWIDSVDVIHQLKKKEEVVEVWADSKIAPMDE